MSRWFVGTMAVTVSLGLVGCKKSEARGVTDRFLGALQAEKYDVAHAELHGDAKKLVPTPAALQTLVKGRGARVTEWSQNCSSGGPSGERLGLDFSSTTTGASSSERVTIGVEPKPEDRCSVGPLFVEALPENGAWKIRTCRF
jgi:hypothetical protein